MKKLFIPLLALLLAFTCLSCGKDKAQESSDSPAIQPQPSETVSQPAEPPAEESTPAQIELTAEMLEELSALFVPGTWYNYALFSDFISPETVNLGTLFYDGDPNETVTDAEMAYLTALPNGDMYRDLDVSKITLPKMDEVLQTYFGITLAETEGNGLDDLVYVPNFSAYFHAHSDTTADLYTFPYGFELENGDVELYYHRTWDSEPFYCIVTLHRSGTGIWQLVSNVPVDAGK